MRPQAGRPMLGGMESTQVTLMLELSRDGESLAGRVLTDAGAASDFAGWLGLVAAIDALVPQQTTRPPEEES